jgi:ATP-dependent helicase/nuclease subunit A
MEESMQSPPFELIDIVVRAGAGAGKTTELTQRVIRLAENFHQKQQRYPHFVVTTFTRKATQELKERLLKEAMKKDDPGLAQFIKRGSQLHISTIHGILNVYLSRFGSVMGLSPKLTVISDAREKFQIKKKIREICQRKDSELNQEFQTLLESAEFSDLLAAFKDYFQLKMQFGDVPFFGTEDFAALVHLKAQTLGAKFKDLAFQLRNHDVPDTWKELTSFCEKVLLQAPKTGESDQYWQQVAEEFPTPRKTKAVADHLAEQRDALKKELEFFASWRVSGEYFQQHQEFCQTFQNFADELIAQLLETKLNSGEITMQDLETLSLMLIRRHPETAEAFSKQWDYWLVDEYQDTSPAQVELLKALSGQSKSFVVGDPQQSIYLFRGARSEVFGAREQAVQEAKGVLFSKLTNYRSQPELLEFFNFLFESLGSQFQKMKPKAEPSGNPTQPVAEIIEVKSDPESKNDVEFEAILFRCQELMKQSVPLEKICVLSRNNRDLDELAWLAQQIGMPVQVHSSGQFFERREIVDALSILKFLCNPHDNKNLIQILRSPVFRVPDQTLYEWCQTIGTSFWQSFVKHQLEPIQKLQSYFQQAQDSGIGQTWRDLLVYEGYFRFAHTMDGSGRREANLWKLVQMVRSEERIPGFNYLDLLKSLDLRSLSTEEPEEADAVPVVEPQKIHLMTVHASKGLQFGHVILPKMGKTLRPPMAEFFLFDETSGQWTISIADPDEGKKVASLSGMHLLETLKRRQKEEEDRLLYVALTRAEETVTLIWEEKPKSDSWATRLPLKKSEGIHTEKSFCYRYRQGRFAPEPIEASKLLLMDEIKPFEAPLEAEVQTFSVTEILDRKQRAQAKGRPQEIADVQKAVTGVDVHRIFETLKYKWMKDPDFAWEEMLSQLPTQQQKALEYLALDQQGLWLDLIRNGEVEYGMAVQFDGKLIQGQIDLWGFDSKGEPWLIDYKTGSPKYQEKAFQQLHIYCWALQKMNRIPSTQVVNLAVIYPFSEITLIEKSPAFAVIDRDLRTLRE